jgi:serine/threonine-protein kinase
MNIGQRIGDYEIVEVLGAGGMGEVYKVRNVLSERLEAMKVLLPNLAGSPELAERFLREIKLQASLDHPNIAKLYTAFRDSNQLLMVMEFVEGQPIDKLLAAGPLMTRESIDYAGQVLDALAYAHGRGVTHRDIKPANIMRTPAGTIKLLDFGIAHMKKDPKLTQTGTTLGSLYYIAPELIKGAEPDARCDIYSLGVVLYEMVTGRKPFQGDSQYSIMAAHMEGAPVAPSDAAPWMPGPLNEVILKAIAKDPVERFQTAGAFKSALESAAAAPADQVATQVMPTATASLPGTPPAASTPSQPALTIPMGTTPPASGPATIPAIALGQQPAPAVPVSAGAPPPPAVTSPPPPASSSHRGFYVALGCLLTLGVLAAAAVEGPRFFRTHADGTTTRTHQAPVQPAPDPGPVSTMPSAEAQPSSAASPGVNQPSGDSSQAGGTQTATQPQTSQTGTQEKTGEETSTQTANPQAARERPALKSRPRSEDAPSSEAQESYREQMHELTQQAEQLTIRAKTARLSLTSLKTQMSDQGLGLRSDVVEAETRMNHHLEKAKQEIASGDAVSAEKDLQAAGAAAEYIEKFLGR